MNRGRPMQNLRYPFFLFWAFCTLVRLTFMFSRTCWTYLERTRRPDRSASFATSWRLFTWHTLPRRIPPEVCCFQTLEMQTFQTTPKNDDIGNRKCVLIYYSTLTNRLEMKWKWKADKNETEMSISNFALNAVFPRFSTNDRNVFRNNIIIA